MCGVYGIFLDAIPIVQLLLFNVIMMQVLRKNQQDRLKDLIIQQGIVVAMRAYIAQTGDRLDTARQVIERLASDIQPGPSNPNRS